MLKALKWAYDIGVRQERTRVAAHLQVHAQQARISNDTFDHMIREEMNKPKPKKNTLERIDFQRSVNARVEEIINEMFNPRGEWIAPASLMFPDEAQK